MMAIGAAMLQIMCPVVKVTATLGFTPSAGTRARLNISSQYSMSQ